MSESETSKSKLQINNTNNPSVFGAKLYINKIENKILNFKEQEARSLHKIEQQKKREEFKLWIQLQKKSWKKEQEVWKQVLSQREQLKHFNAQRLKINPIMQNEKRWQSLTTTNKDIKARPFYDKRFIDIGNKIKETEILKKQEHDKIFTEKLQGKEKIKVFNSSRINSVKLYKNDRMDKYKKNMTELQEEVSTLQDVETNLMNKLKSTESSALQNGSYLNAAQQLNSDDFKKKYLNQLKEHQTNVQKEKFLLNLEEQPPANQQKKEKSSEAKQTFLTSDL